MRKIIKSYFTPQDSKFWIICEGIASGSVFYIHANQSFAWSQHGGTQNRISDIAHFTHSKNLANMIEKLQQPPD